MKKLILKIEAPEDLEPGEILRAISGLGIEGIIMEPREKSTGDPCQMSFEWETRPTSDALS